MFWGWHSVESILRLDGQYFPLWFCLFPPETKVRYKCFHSWAASSNIDTVFCIYEYFNDCWVTAFLNVELVPYDAFYDANSPQFQSRSVFNMVRLFMSSSSECSALFLTLFCLLIILLTSPIRHRLCFAKSLRWLFKFCLSGMAEDQLVGQSERFSGLRLYTLKKRRQYWRCQARASLDRQAARCHFLAGPEFQRPKVSMRASRRRIVVSAVDEFDICYRRVKGMRGTPFPLRRQWSIICATELSLNPISSLQSTLVWNGGWSVQESEFTTSDDRSIEHRCWLSRTESALFRRGRRIGVPLHFGGMRWAMGRLQPIDRT